METLSFKSVFLGVFAVLLVTVYFYFRRKYSYWKNKGVAYLKPSFPFGNFADIALFRKSFGETYAEQYKKLTGKRFGGIYILNRPQLLVRDPDLIKNLLVKDFDHFHDHAFASDEKIDPLSGNLFMLTGSKWRELRTKLSPTFTSGKMKMMFETLTDCGMELREHVRETTEQADMLEIREVLARFSTDVIASCAFGIKCNCLKNPDAEFRQWGKKIFTPTFETITRGLLYMLMPSIAIGLKISSSPKEITKFFRTMVQETVAYRQKYSVNRNDFLQLLIRLMNKQTHESDDPVEQLNGKDAGLTMDEVAAQVFVFFIGGFETSSITMSFCLYELVLNPDVQQRLQDEIDTVLQEYGGMVTYEAIQKMEYLEKTVAETLRKYPPVTFLSRMCTKDYPIPGTEVILEKGTEVAIPTEAIHHDPQYYDDPERFDPERFSEEAKSKRHHYVYLPFGEGPRICIGMRFGLMQTKVGLVSLLSAYEFSVCNKTAIPLKKDPMQFNNVPLGGIWLQIKKRMNKSV